MFHFIKRNKSIIAQADAEWQIACVAWLMGGSGGFGRFQHAILVSPTDEFFPQRGGRSEGVLEREIFEQVRSHAGMTRWPVDFAAHEATADPQVSDLVAVRGSERSAAGTFRTGAERPLITHEAGSTRDPEAFVATIAHELGHYLISEMRESPPGGVDLEEPAADVAAIFLGFGLFLANAAFAFEQFDAGATHGWRTRRQGYLSESQTVNALAMFVSLLGIDPQRAVRHLKPHLRRLFKKAYIWNSSDKLASLRSIPPITAESRDIVYSGKLRSGQL